MTGCTWNDHGGQWPESAKSHVDDLSSTSLLTGIGGYAYILCEYKYELVFTLQKGQSTIVLRYRTAFLSFIMQRYKLFQFISLINSRFTIHVITRPRQYSQSG